MVTTKQKPTVDTQKIKRMESKHAEDIKKGRKEQGNYKTTIKQLI